MRPWASAVLAFAWLSFAVVAFVVKDDRLLVAVGIVCCNVWAARR